MKGKFITFEGGEGTGKSTQAATLAERLRALGIHIREERDEGATVSLYVEDPSGNTIELIARAGETRA